MTERFSHLPKALGSMVVTPSGIVMVITVFVRCPVAAEIDSRCNPGRIQIRIVRRRTIRRPVIHLFRILHAVHIVYVIRFEQRNRIRRLSIVVIQSVKSRCQIHRDPSDQAVRGIDSLRWHKNAWNVRNICLELLEISPGVCYNSPKG